MSDSRALPAPHANSRHIAVIQDGWRYSGPPREQFELSRAQDCSPGRLAPMPRRKACQWRRNSRRCRLGSSSATCLSYRGNMTVSASGEEAVQGMLLTCIARTSLSESICASWRPQSLSWRTVRDTSGQDGLHRRPRGVCRHGRRRELQQPKMSAAQLTCSVEGVHTSSQHQRARSRHERVHGQVSCHLQSIQSITRELPPYDSLDVHVSQEHHEVALWGSRHEDVPAQ